MLKRFLVPVLSIAFLAAVETSCVKRKFDEPPVNEIPVGNVKTIAQMKDTFTSNPIKFTSDISVYGVVTMDDRDGNIYKNAYIQDGTGGIVIRTLSSGGLYEGDSVRLYLKGTVLSMYGGVLQLDSVNVEKNIIKQATKKTVTPEVVTISQLNNSSNYNSKLIKLENVEFVASDLNKTWADAVGLSSANRTLTDCDGNTIIVRSSGYAKYAGNVLPSGNGSIVAIASEYNGTKQLYLREYSEVNMTGTRCTGVATLCDPVASVSENFTTASNNVDLQLSCWANIASIGSRLWRGRSGTDANGTHIQATAFGSSEQSKTFLISPVIAATGTNSLSFDSQVSFYTHEAMTVYISMNYDGTNLTTATWIPVSATIAGSSSGSSWVNSGVLPLFGYMPQGYTGSFVIAFVYEGNGATGQTTSFRLDNININ
ncbi:MAG: hypothetical protein RL264_689 [Bacteroidota bacterium]|jgi:hypothetical protein